jgi:hypothetical protein
LRRIFCLLFLVTTAVALSAVALLKADAIGAVASLHANQGLIGLGNALPVNVIVVANTNDSGPGSLRQALIDANDGDTISFDSSLNGQKIAPTSGQLNVDKDVTISGPGPNNLAVDGNAQSRVFYVNPDNTVAIDGLTVANGYSDAQNNGVGIFNDTATLTLSNCIISGNSGGGIGNEGFRGSATLMVTNCIVSGNTATFNGGGIDNGADEGGALLTITNSTISGNSADFGGGIGNGGGKGARAIVTVSNSTISGNSADNGGGIGNAAAVDVTSGVTVSNSTLSGNWATGNGGGVYNIQAGGSATLELSNTILNTGSSGENIFNNGGTVTSHGYNLSSDNGGGYLTATGDQINTDPLLSPLQDTALGIFQPPA